MAAAGMAPVADAARLRGPGATGPDAADGDSMFRNAYALMLSTGVSAALGLGFWLVAARYYTEEAVGQGSAAIAAMRLLASLTATTMIGAVVRYVPRAGRATGALVWRAYAVSSLVVCAACVVFLATLDLWGPSYAPLDGVTAGIVFTAACVAWALLTLQDGVLTGLRRAFWVPVGNAAFSLGKLLLLAAFATAMPVLGVFVSWAAAIALSVLPLGWLIFRRLIPRQAAADHDREPPGARDIGRFLAGDSLGALFSLAMINLLPVLVAVRFDAAHNAFFYTAYTVGGTMEFMAINMASSLTAHASHSPDRLAEGVRGALRRMTVLLVPVVLVLVVFAPQVLAPFGADYARHGTTVLRLLAAAALPRVVVELYIGVLRVQGRTGMLAALQGAMCVLVLGSALFLLGPAGISGAGLAVLLSMTVMALIAAPGLRAALRSAGGRRAPRTKDTDAYGTSWARESARLRAEAMAASVRRLPVPANSPASGDSPPSADSPASVASAVDESRVITVVWLLLGLAGGLFWPPLVRLGDIGRDQLTGTQLLTALPPLTLVAGILLIVVQCAAVSLVRPGPALLTLGPLATFAALHSAPVLLGVRPDRASGPWHEPVAGLLTGLLDGVWDADGVLRGLPVALQLLSLGLAAVTLRALGTDARVTAGAVWVLAVAGWAGQKQFAAVALPVSLGVCAPAALALVVRVVLVVRRRHRAGIG
ncbi:lipopolysaccharide biosynthesis protein [Streptomyces sp. NPDC056835]|uniref:lipopolysaccharide biosynthesis protein n=1 Tax=Streptomyces sp. NPDC056835 TaxID=3345956 RepID=UPI0036B8E706